MADRDASPQRDRAGQARGHHGASRRHRMDSARGPAPRHRALRLRQISTGTFGWEPPRYRPYAPGYHPSAWRGWQDFGTGWSGDIGCHLFNVAYQGLELTAPSTVKAQVQESWAKSPARRADTWPQSNHITWTFPGTPHTAKELSSSGTTASSCRRRKILNRIEIPNFRPYESTLFIGSEGVLFWPSGGGPQLWPQAKVPRDQAASSAEVGPLPELCGCMPRRPRPQCASFPAPVR